MTQRRGLLLIISSPSGAGKSTISRRLRAWDPTIRFSVSATTRAPREGEVDGKDYFFSTREEFETLVTNGGVAHKGQTHMTLLDVNSL